MAANKKTFYVKMVKSEGVKSQSIHVIDAKDAFEAISLIRSLLGIMNDYDIVEAHPWHGEIYYPEEKDERTI